MRRTFDQMPLKVKSELVQIGILYVDQIRWYLHFFSWIRREIVILWDKFRK